VSPGFISFNGLGWSSIVSVNVPQELHRTSSNGKRNLIIPKIGAGQVLGRRPFLLQDHRTFPALKRSSAKWQGSCEQSIYATIKIFQCETSPLFCIFTFCNSAPFTLETYFLPEDIQIVYVTAPHFPEGISDAYDDLRAILPSASQRRYFGLSRPEEGKINYKAASEALFAGEGEQLKLESMVIKAGVYAAIVVENYPENLQSIGNAFHQILLLKNLDHQGYCVECYLSSEQVRCMIRLDQ
jgi:hypothetical protein